METQATEPSRGEAQVDVRRAPKIDPCRLDARLDEAIEESFPASDPPAVSLHDEPPSSPRIEPTADRTLSGPHGAQARSMLARIGSAAAVAVVAIGGVALARFLKNRRPGGRIH